MNFEDIELKRDMFAIDIANMKGILKNYFTEYKGINIAHSDKKKTLDGLEHVFARMERPNENGFDFAEVILPENKFYLSFGFSDGELLCLRDYLNKNIDKIMRK